MKFAVVVGALALVFGPRLAVPHDGHAHPSSLTAFALSAPTNDAAITSPRADTNRSAASYVGFLASAVALLALTRRALVLRTNMATGARSPLALPHRRGPPNLPA